MDTPPAGSPLSESDRTTNRWHNLVPSDHLGWFSALLDFPEIDQRLLDFTRAAVGIHDESTSWPFFSASLVGRGLAETLDHRVRLTAEGRTAVIVELRPLADAAPARRAFVEHWLENPDPLLAEPIATWAARLKAWDLMSEIWLALHANVTNRASVPTPSAFRNVPDLARRRDPVLSWAMAVAGAESGQGRQSGSTFARLLLRDALLLHSQWLHQPDIDAAVLGGTMWMSAQRLLPSSGGEGGSPAVSWRTHSAIRRRIEVDSETGAVPSPLAQTVFSAFSAQSALARGDLLSVVAEARTAQLIGAGGRGVSWFAAGLEALGDALYGAHTDPPFVPRLPVVNSRQPGDGDLRESGAALLELARGVQALDRLDQDALAEALTRARTPGTFGGVGRPVRILLEAMQEAIWGQPPRAIEVLVESSTSVADSAQDTAEPLAQMLLGLARVTVLNLVGANDLAKQTAERLPAPGRYPALARTLLWNGELRECVRVATLGLLHDGIWRRMRTDLLVTKAAALALDHSAPTEERRRTVRVALTRAWKRDRMLALAFIPAGARVALLDTFAEIAEGEEIEMLAGIRSRLIAVIEHGSLPPAVQLTKREQVLLPLLATAESVPDIAEALQVSANTVRKQVVTLRAKFNANSRAELIRNARAAGFLR